jgi:Lhr-like helicase
MLDFSVENLAFNIALEFRKHYKKYTFKVYRIDNVKQSKWWPHFIKTAEKYINQEGFDYKFFIKIQFETYGKVLPHFLAGKQAEKAYKQNYYKENSTEEKIVSEVRGAKEAIKLWSNRNKKDFSDYFDASNTFLLVKRIEYLSPYYLAFSKNFLSSYAKLSEEQREEVYSKRELNLKRAYVNQHPEAKKEVRDILEDDFI